MLPTIIDNETGERILVTDEEDALLTVLSDRFLETLSRREKTAE
jgi:hypothetical protein